MKRGMAEGPTEGLLLKKKASGKTNQEDELICYTRLIALQKAIFLGKALCCDAREHIDDQYTQEQFVMIGTTRL
jgi:hypothetical protein